MNAHKLLNDLFDDALAIVIITLAMGQGTGFAVAPVLAPIRRAIP